jgi:hypothetical protein
MQARFSDQVFHPLAPRPPPIFIIFFENIYYFKKENKNKK